MRLYSAVLASFALAVLPVGCSSDGSGGADPTVPLDSLEYADELDRASDVVTIGGRAHRLTAYAWRDFMPGASPARGLRCVATLTAVDGAPVDGALRIDELVIAQNGRAWVFRPETRRDGAADRIDGLALDGPYWETGSLVDVAVVLSGVGAAGERSFAVGRAVPIERTD